MIIRKPFVIFLGFFLFMFAGLVFAERVEIGLSKEEKVKKAQEYYSAGREMSKQGDYTQANEAFKKAQQLLGRVDPKSVAAIAAPVNNASMTQAALGEPPAAKKEIEPLIIRGSPEEMAIHYLRAIEKSPKDPNLYYNLGVEYLRSNRFSLAAEAFSQVIRLNPKDKDAYYNLGVLFESYFNNKNQALIFYGQYLKLTNNSEDASRVRSWIKQIKKESSDK
ncbi:MAG: tetratricopeptide repeat protein [Candidatus Omnitrophota bacterium]|nr:tetratricopeptide repeat protein [Candidatus Omnitrophota bacterium]MBU1929496.1 tetratricopeptide repeat protein [Candidatus Omnitrophota bacterium]MBU2034957.1 tetratricopeptide repeat protein [Candidatus Omnitrophota bacterium]MBU2222067.1 tetratricopeptide repeat protein [Candidatus Omnitrophota bacterium]MBU2258493.1 tetratricopeptide repeat protein [Candidatus Omnitrophota bacterium]